MTFGVFLQLTQVGSGVGPLVDLYSDVDNYTTPFETGLTVSYLLTNPWINTVPDGTTIIKVQSYGDCNNFILIPINNLPCDCLTDCCQFQISNNSGGARTWSYYDCEGNIISGLLSNSNVVRFCADQSLGPIFVDDGCTLTEFGCCYECRCYTLTNNTNLFTVRYRDCLGNLITTNSTFTGDGYVVDYCGGAPTIISGWADSVEIGLPCYWNQFFYTCAL
jgi:hypothetical protein